MIAYYVFDSCYRGEYINNNAFQRFGIRKYNTPMRGIPPPTLPFHVKKTERKLCVKHANSNDHCTLLLSMLK